MAGGTYVPSPFFSDATFRLKNGVEIDGGYAGAANPANPNERTTSKYVTRLSGEIGNPADRSDNIFHVVTGNGTNATAILDGVTISGGFRRHWSAFGFRLHIHQQYRVPRRRRLLLGSVDFH